MVGQHLASPSSQYKYFIGVEREYKENSCLTWGEGAKKIDPVFTILYVLWDQTDRVPINTGKVSQ